MEKARLTLKGTLTTGEPDWTIELEGREWTPEEIAGFVRFGKKYQFGTLDDILKERGLMVEGERLVKALR